MKFIKFNDSQIDSFLFMELGDLAKTLTKNADTEIQYEVQSYLDPFHQVIYLSHFWNQRPFQDTVAGLKSDLYLRSIGSFFYTDHMVVRQFLKDIKKSPLSGFGKQLFTLLEDIRLEEICKSERPGTAKYFIKRRELYRRFFKTQMTINLERSIFTDALFNGVYLKVTAGSPLDSLPFILEDLLLLLPFLENELSKVYDANATSDIAKLTLNILEVLEEVLVKDMLNTYFFLSESIYDEIDTGMTFDELKRKSKLDQDDSLGKLEKEDKDVHEDKLPTWHRETSEATKSFLKFDLEHGSKTDLEGNGVREGEDGEQALGTVQGSARSTARKDYSKLEALDDKRKGEEFSAEHLYGKDNSYAVPFFLEPRASLSEEVKKYRDYKYDILIYQKKMKQMIQKMLEHKRNMPRNDLHIGRLNKKLLRLLTEDNPRMFYKKDRPSNQIDAVFSLLVDCSASMFDKMDETKRGIVLFHEALKSVQVPHQVTGFWEDTGDATATYQPNYFKRVLSYKDSLKSESGPAIMQLEPEEDNRDGYAIRHMSNELSARSEKQKFLLVFSDGEPAAMNYEQNGIVDTHEAVLEARKQGIEVINVFLSNGEVEESQYNTIKNIYGNFSIMVTDVEELPDVLFPLLKKLLKKSLRQ
ncbi:vWA domain-containing protein [Metabacillus sp. RGM 3146]|uniref:vWA domain-containing protein n=1 Tax=Metabacillus sp. RGM 3146 TaxID=3401092 RepID=UPI003B9C974E